MDFVQDYLENNITIAELSRKYNISEWKIKNVFKLRNIKKKQEYKKKQIEIKADNIFDIFLEDFLNTGKSMKYYAEKYDVNLYQLNLRLTKYFKTKENDRLDKNS